MQWPGLKGKKLITHNWRDFLKLHEGRGPAWWKRHSRAPASLAPGMPDTEGLPWPWLGRPLAAAGTVNV